MSPALLGICLGILNVVANAALFAAVGDEPRAAGMMFTYGILPGITAGSLIGALAGACATTSRGTRLFVIALPAVFVIGVLAEGFKLTSFLPISLVPTLACCAILEARTRKDPFAIDATADVVNADHVPALAPRSALKVSMLLGAVVMFIVLIGVCATENDLEFLAEIYLPWGMGIGIGLAAPFGVIADQTRAWTVWPRRIVLLVAAFALTTTLGSLVEMESLILVAFIPVAAGCLMLERYSRLPPAVPSAIASIARTS